MNNKLPFLLNEYELSKWAFRYCLNINDNQDIRNYITDSQWAYLYCRCINDDPEVRKNITNSRWVNRYCNYIDKKENLNEK